MSAQQPPAAKKRKANEAVEAQGSKDESTRQQYHPSLPSVQQYYASPQHYAAQYSHQSGYPYAPSQQYPYHPSPPQSYGSMPTSGYPTIPPLHHTSIHGTVHHQMPSSNSFVTPETQQVPSSSAFASPPSSLRRHALSATDRGASTTSSGKASNRPCKFIYFSWIPVCWFPFNLFEFTVLIDP
jgi:hypothetical protein